MSVTQLGYHLAATKIAHIANKLFPGGFSPKQCVPRQSPYGRRLWEVRFGLSESPLGSSVRIRVRLESGYVMFSPLNQTEKWPITKLVKLKLCRPKSCIF
jgi:hypothetical protein